MARDSTLKNVTSRFLEHFSALSRPKLILLSHEEEPFASARTFWLLPLPFAHIPESIDEAFCFVGLCLNIYFSLTPGCISLNVSLIYFHALDLV
jgi:hypothetical protein